MAVFGLIVGAGTAASVTSYEAGDHDWWYHGILYQEQIRAPLIFNGPGLARGLVVDDVVEHVDLFPTLLDLAQGAHSELPDGLHGESLLPLLRGETAGKREGWAYSEAHNILAVNPSPERRKRGELYCLIDGRLKLIHHPQDPSLDQLYDLRADPRELANLIDERPEQAQDLLARLVAMEAADGFLPDASTLPRETRERLKSLGYVD